MAPRRPMKCYLRIFGDAIVSVPTLPSNALWTPWWNKVLVLTMYEDDESVFAALRAGACGYLLKGANQTELLRAIRGVAEGEVIFGAGVAQRVLGYFAAPRPSVPRQPFPDLTDREREILGLIARGRGNAQIAEL